MFKMNEIVNKFLLAGDKLMPEMHLKQPGFTYSSSAPFTKKSKELKNLQRLENTDFIYRSDFDKAYFQNDMTYCESKDLSRRTQSDKFLRNKAFEIASNPKYDGYQRGPASMVYMFF